MVSDHARDHVDLHRLLLVYDIGFTDGHQNGRNDIKGQKWKADGIPNDGIGSQSHLPSGGASKVQGALTALAGSSVSEVAMTELEIVGNAVSDWVTAVKACLAVTSCVGITVSSFTYSFESV